MAYSDFTLDALFHRFGVTVEIKTGLVFSGVEFNVERKTGLTGFCDFLLSRSPNLLRLDAPVACLVKAKKEDLNGGLPQCVAEMIAAQRFNEQRKAPTPVVYGCVTSGTTWRFVQLENQSAYVDLDEVYIAEADKIFGILLHMARGKTEATG